MSRTLAVIAHDLTALWLQEAVAAVKPGAEFVRVKSAHEVFAAADSDVEAVFLDTVCIAPHGAAITRRVLAEHPQAAVFIVMDDCDIETASACIAVGARCLITRSAGSAAVRAGLAAVWPAAPVGEQRATTGRGGFTAREISILASMAEGLSNVDIGARLFVSADTVKTQAKRLFIKLGVHDRAAAVAAGLRRGLIA